MSIRIVLVATTHPGNIGSAARAMKVMGLHELWLVRPERYPAPEATAMASAATDVLEAARVVGSVREAVADCGLVVGTTARSRHLPWRVVEPREAAADLLAAARSGPVAILFGAERAGLTNDEIEQCQRLLTIPAAPRYASLNVAMAVQLVAYEIWLAQRSGATADVRPAGEEGGVPLASALEMERFYEQLERVLLEIDFRDRTGSGHLMARLRRLFNRAVMDQNEVNILRGVLTAVQGRRRRAGDPPRRPGAQS